MRRTVNDFDQSATARNVTPCSDRKIVPLDFGSPRGGLKVGTDPCGEPLGSTSFRVER